MHYDMHETDCLDPLGKEDWKADVAKHGRPLPKFPSEKGFGGTTFLWGNTPAFDILKLEMNEGEAYDRDLNIYFAGIKNVDSNSKEYQHPNSTGQKSYSNRIFSLFLKEFSRKIRSIADWLCFSLIQIIGIPVGLLWATSKGDVRAEREIDEEKESDDEKENDEEEESDKDGRYSGNNHLEKSVYDGKFNLLSLYYSNYLFQMTAVMESKDPKETIRFQKCNDSGIVDILMAGYKRTVRHV